MNMPALFKILCLFTGIVVLYKIGVPLWGALLAIALASGLWFGAGFVHTLELAGLAAIEQETLFLCAVVVIILGFSNLMAQTGILNSMVDSYNLLLGKSMYSGAALPALIGLLPMPGGAIFSAPMVEAACGPEGSQTAEQKASMNYWFRHIWEYWWPLYPGVILASHLFHVSMWKMVLIHFPFTIFAVVGGWFFILRPAFASDGKGQTNGPRPPGLLWKALSQSACIIVVIATIFIAGPAIAATGAVTGMAAKYWPVILGFVFGSAWVIVTMKVPAKTAAKHMLAKNQFEMFMLAVGIMVFRDMLNSMEAFAGAQADLAAYHIPPIAVIAALPLLAGLVMGIAIGFVGASLPLVISLLPDNVMNSELRFAYLALAYSFGYMGMMMSPVHFCFIMTKDYFKAEFGKMYKLLIGPAMFVLVGGIIFFFLYRTLFS